MGCKMSDKPISRQRVWQIKRMAEGKCMICSTPRDESSKVFCPRCLKMDRDRERKRRKAKSAIDKVSSSG